MKHLFAGIALITLFILQSCHTNIDLTLHKDQTISGVIAMDYKESLEALKVNNMTPNDIFPQVMDIPTEWTSFYDLSQSRGETLPTEKDSIKTMKSLFMKSTKERNLPVGTSFKFDHLTQKQMNQFMDGASSSLDKSITSLLPIAFQDKKAELNLEAFTNEKLAYYIDLQKRADTATNSLDFSDNLELAQLMRSKQKATLRFESKIKNIKGQHDWLRKTDDYTVVIQPDFLTLNSSFKKLKNDDKKITIITE